MDMPRLRLRHKSASGEGLHLHASTWHNGVYVPPERGPAAFLTRQGRVHARVGCSWAAELTLLSPAELMMAVTTLTWPTCVALRASFVGPSPHAMGTAGIRCVSAARGHGRALCWVIHAPPCACAHTARSIGGVARDRCQERGHPGSSRRRRGGRAHAVGGPRGWPVSGDPSARSRRPEGA